MSRRSTLSDRIEMLENDNAKLSERLANADREITQKNALINAYEIDLAQIRSTAELRSQRAETIAYRERSEAAQREIDLLREVLAVTRQLLALSMKTVNMDAKELQSAGEPAKPEQDVTFTFSNGHRIKRSEVVSMYNGAPVGASPYIYTIKVLRERVTDLTLKEAKDFMDQNFGDLRAQALKQDN